MQLPSSHTLKLRQSIINPTCYTLIYFGASGALFHRLMLEMGINTKSILHGMSAPMHSDGMKTPHPGKNNPGGECMEQSEIQIGAAVYAVQRVFAGERPAGEVLIDRLIRNELPDSSFDERARNAL